MLLGVCLHCFLSVSSAMNDVSPRCVSMVCCLLVMPRFVMFGLLPMVMGGTCKRF